MKKTNYLAAAIVAAAFASLASPAAAAVKPNPLFSDHMVLQRGMPVPVWGTANEGEKVTVEFNGQKATTTATGGKWMVRLKSLKAGGPHTLTISGDNTIRISNVLVGEVWIASGQSNMQWAVRQSHDPQGVAAGANNPQIRLFTVPRQATDTPLTEVQASWQPSNSQTVMDFSAVAYHFGKELQTRLKVPVGLISTNYGGTVAEAWTRNEVLQEGFPNLVTGHTASLRAYRLAQAQYASALSEHAAAVERARQAGQQPPPALRAPGNPAQSVNRPSGLYNAMIAPLIPYAMRGAIWYQGESNAGRAWEYRTLFPAMIQNWREDWGQGDFPFLFVQLAPFMRITPEPGESTWAELREAQLLTTRTVPNTGMAVITDVGDEADIHPQQKEPVGRRLAYAALAMTYGQKVPYSGPQYHRMKVEDGRAVLSFKHTGSGLEARGGSLKGFTIAGADGRWVNAQAEVRGDQVVVWSPQVKEPVAVRYGWANYPTGNLWNKDNLPASPFRTDEFRITTQPR